METVYWSHFAEKRGVPPQPHPRNGKGDFESIWGLGVHLQNGTFIETMVSLQNG